MDREPHLIMCGHSRVWVGPLSNIIIPKKGSRSTLWLVGCRDALRCTHQPAPSNMEELGAVIQDLAESFQGSRTRGELETIKQP